MADVEIVDVTATPMAVVRRVAAQAELKTVIPEALGVVWTHLRARGIKPLGRNVVVYLDKQMNIELGVEVPDDFAGDDILTRSATPAGTVAHIAHIGPYRRMCESYDKLKAWSQETGRTLVAPSWEVYGHWTQDESQLRTDIYFSVAPG